MTDKRARPIELSDALRWFRTHVGINQTEAGVRMGFPVNSAQTSVSQRERPVGHPDYTEVRVTELYRLEVASGVQPGTILRHAGYVEVDELALPPELTPTIREGIIHMIELDLASKTPPPERRKPQPRKRGIDDLFGDEG